MSSSKKEKLHPRKKQQQVSARHWAAGMCRLPQRHHSRPPTTRNECSHEPLAGIERVLTLKSGEVCLRPLWLQQTSTAKRRTAQWWTQARLRVAARCRERFRPCRSLASNWPRGRSVRNVLACKVREGLRAQTREGFEPQVDVALALCLVQRADHLASGRIMMFASVVIFPHCFLRASTDLFSWYCSASCDAWRHMLRRTAFPARALAGKPSHRQLRQKKSEICTGRLESHQTSNFSEELQLVLREGFSSHSVLNGSATALAGGAHVLRN